MRPYLCLDAGNMRFRWLVSVVVLWSVACDDNSGAGGRLPDAPPGQTDAAVDAPVMSVDASPPPDPPRPVKLTVLRDGVPVAGVRTYFLRADGSPASSTETSALGVATATGLDGGSVTAIDPFKLAPQPDPGLGGSGIHDLRTFVGVKAGDELVLTLSKDRPALTVELTVSEHSNAVLRYEVFTTCGSGTIEGPVEQPEAGLAAVTGSITLRGCNGTADFLITPIGDIGNEQTGPLGALFRKDVAVTDGGTVDLTAGAYEAVGSATLNFKNLPLDLESFQLRYRLATQRARLSFERTDEPTRDGATATSVLAGVPALPGATAVINTKLTVVGEEFPDDIVASTYELISQLPAAAVHDFDLASATQSLPPAFLSFPAFNPTTRRISWVEAEQGSAPDLTVARILVTRSADERTTRWIWTLAAPYTPGEVKFPILPDDIQNWTPSVKDEVDVRLLLNAVSPGDYDGVRARIHDIVTGAQPTSPGTVITVEATQPDLELPTARAPTRRAPAVRTPGPRVRTR